MSLINKIKQNDIKVANGVSDKDIQDAEQRLGTTFPNSYKEILSQFGIIEIGSDEYFGLGVKGYLNIVETTLKERGLANGKLEDYIVMQNLGTEGILIVFDEEDNVYEYHNGEFNNLLSTTSEFIEHQISKL